MDFVCGGLSATQIKTNQCKFKYFENILQSLGQATQCLRRACPKMLAHNLASKLQQTEKLLLQSVLYALLVQTVSHASDSSWSLMIPDNSAPVMRVITHFYSGAGTGRNMHFRRFWLFGKYAGKGEGKPSNFAGNPVLTMNSSGRWFATGSDASPSLRS